MYPASIKNLYTKHQISFWLDSLIWKLSLFEACLPPCHSARSQRRSRRIHIPKLTLALRERGDRPRRWVRIRQKHFTPPLIRPEGHLLPRKKFSFAFWNVDSATPGKLWVQNDMGVRWQNGRRNQLIKRCIVKRLDLNRFCSILITWTNQKPMYPVSIKNLYT